MKINVYLRYLNPKRMPEPGYLSLLTLYRKNRLFFRCLYSIALGALLISCQKSNDLPLQLGDEGKADQAKRLYQQSLLYKNSGNDSLNIIAEQLIKLGKTHEDTAIIVDGTVLKANYEWMLSNDTEAMKLAMGALEYAEKTGLKHKIPKIYGIIGNLYKENGHFDQAFDAAKKGMEAAQLVKDTAQVIYMMRLRAMFTHSQGITEKSRELRKRSLALHLEGLQLAESHPKFERSRIAYYDNISQYYKITGDYEKGIYYGNKGAELALKYNQKRSLTYAYNWLGEIYYYQGDHEKGLDYLNKALQTAVDLKSSYREMEIIACISDAYFSSGDYKNAWVYHLQYTDLHDSLLVNQNAKQLSDLQLRYETEKKDQQIASLGAINKEKTQKNVLVLIGLIITLVLFSFLFFQYRTIRKHNKLLRESNHTINEQSQKMQVLMKELHHRVKNNLQIVSSLLSLQSNRLTDKNAQQAVRIGQQRIEAMSLIHRSLYHQENPNMVDMQAYVSDLVESIFQTFGANKSDYDWQHDIDLPEMDVDIALPLGLIINEWVTNAFKHAYKDVSRPSLQLTLKQDDGIRLKIKDNGPGMKVEDWEKPQGSFGIKLVKVLSKQLNGKCRMESGNGTALVLQIPHETFKQAG